MYSITALGTHRIEVFKMKFPNFYFKRRKRPSYLRCKFSSGGKNLIPYPYYQKDGVDRGVTWTTNGRVIVANGTPNKETSYFICNSMDYDKQIPLSPGKYQLSGVLTDQIRLTLGVRTNETDQRTLTRVGYNEVYTFDVTNDTTRVDVVCAVDVGIVVDNAMFEPKLIKLS